MGVCEFPNLSWSVRLDAPTSACGRAIEDLVRQCTQICDREFADTEGYSLTTHRLSGPLEGVTLKLTCGEFRGIVSLQQFHRPHDGTLDQAVRVVASARFEPSLLPARMNRCATQWGLAGCTLGGLGVGAVVLQLAGFLTTWSQVVFLLPALMIWRLYMAIRIATDLQREARAEAERSSLLALAEAEDSPLRRAKTSWDTLLRFLATQRDALVAELHRRPFRSAALESDQDQSAEAALVVRPRVAL